MEAYQSLGHFVAHAYMALVRKLKGTTPRVKVLEVLVCRTESR